MAGTEVSKEVPEEVSKEVSKVVGIEEKCGLDMNSHQDQSKPQCNGSNSNHHNQANDLDNSYVFVTGTDDLPDVAVGVKDVGAAVEDQGAKPESRGEKLDAVSGGFSESGNKGDNENAGMSIGDPAVVSDSAGGVPQTGHIENLAEAEVKQVVDLDGKVESSEAAVLGKVGDKNVKLEGAVEGEQEKLDYLITSGSVPGPVENQESEGGAKLVSESGEKGELSNISSHFANGECGDRVELTAIETSKMCEGSPNLVVDVVECELQDASVEAKDEVKLESHPINNKGVIPKEEARTNLSLDVLENEQGDTTLGNNVQTLLEPLDEAKSKPSSISENVEEVLSEKDKDDISESHIDNDNSVASSMGCHVETVIIEKDKDISVSHFDNGKSVSSSSDCHVETVSIEKDKEEVSVSHVDNGKSVLSSHVETGLIEKEKEDVSVSHVHVDNGIPSPEEHPNGSEVSGEIVQSKINSESSVPSSHVEAVLIEKDKEDVSASLVHVDNGLSCPEVLEEHPNGSEAYCDLVQSETNSEASVPNGHVEMVLVEKDKEDISASHVGNGIPCPEEPEEHQRLNDCEASRDVVQSETNSASSVPSSHVETVLIVDKEKEDVSSSQVENGIPCPEEPEKYPNGSEASREIVQSETKSEASLPTSHVETVLIETEKEDVSASHVDNGIPCPEEPEENPNESEASSEIVQSETNSVASVPNSHVATVLIVEKGTEDVSVSHVDNGIPCPEEHPSGSEASPEIFQSETNSEASVPTQSFPASNAHVPQTEISDAEIIGEVVSSSPVDDQKSQIIENEASAGSNSTLEAVVTTEKEQTSQGGEAQAETEVSSGKAEVENGTPATYDVKLGPEVCDSNFPALRSVKKTGDATVGCSTKVLNSSNVSKEVTASIVLDSKDVEGKGDKLDGAANEDTGNSQSNNLFVASPEGSSGNVIDGEEASIKSKPKPFNFLIRISRFDDDNLREKIRLAKLHVDEKTKLRDAIQVQIQELRANSQIHGIDYEYAKGEARSARKLVKTKRMEIGSLQSVIDKAKNALSIDDIDSQMYNMEHMIQHETLALKEEKQLIREIKQLKQIREQLSSNMGSQDEIKQALEQREEVEGRLKILRKELDVLKDKVVKAEAAAREAETRYDAQNKKVKELQSQFRVADDVRQEAYAQWQNLRKEFSKKSKPFFKYKDDAAIASNYAFSRDTDALYRLCTNQVENVMDLWNNSDEFRQDYVKFNTRSTIRRFGTLDGRSLGPDEKPLILPSYDARVNRMVSTPAKVTSISQIPTLDLKQETSVENVASDGKLTKKVTEHKNQKVTNKEPATTISVQANDLDKSVVFSSKVAVDEVHEEPKKSKEEIESIRKEEEMRRAEAEAKLKEQRRLEALAKAHEARERKKRQAEKLQMRAELKTQKEAEQREKEREKRLRKKERKKAAASTDVNDTNSNCETIASSESASEITSKDLEVKETSSSAAPKKPQKPWLFSKQTKTKSVVPPPLRNRNKKKLQQWMWVGFTSLIILVLFWMGNMGLFTNVNLKRRNPGY